MDKTYVYEGVEVRKTGRTAVRTVKSRTMTLVEIAPVDESFQWKKWVAPEQLYEVKE